ncbi:MAG TPA: SDR family NAD(P)-dependent oxidoreductase [Acidimicrobiales bacterium]
MSPDRRSSRGTGTGVALVTGGSGALGAAVCRELDAMGYRVAIHYAGNEDGAIAVQKDCVNDSVVVRADVASWDEVKAMEELVRERLGPVSVLVNSAAVRLDGLMATQPVAEWQRTIEVNLLGTFHTCRACVPQMLLQRWGRVVNVVSPIGTTGNAGQTAYSASKAGVVGLTKSLALECGRRGVTVNALSPGFMESAMVASLPETTRAELIGRAAIRRVIDPSEVAAAVRFLVESPAVTGTILSVDGGMSS